jgi:hypothetical protein
VSFQGHLLGFIVSNKGIMVDPLKVEAIVQFPPLHKYSSVTESPRKGQFPSSFHCKLCRHHQGIYALVERKGSHSVWDKFTNDPSMHLRMLMSSPLLSPPDYSRDFLLYIVAVESTVNMVLVQEDDSSQEHVIYYLSHGLIGPELNYSHVEKLALEVVHVVQRLRHYILLRKTIVVACQSISIHPHTTYNWGKIQ